jgi:small-conductance mechanosensitive channel
MRLYVPVEAFTIEFLCRRSDMQKNMGTLDRIIRIVLVIVIAVLYFAKVISGTAAIILGIIGLILLITSLTSVCLLYIPFKISTKKKEQG